MEAIIARPYAKAAFEYAAESHLTSEWLRFLQYAGLLVKKEELRVVLNNPKLDCKQVAEIFVGLCKKYLVDGAENFLYLLAENRRLTVLPEIYEIFLNYLSTQLQTVEVEINSAEALNDSQIAKLEKSLARYFNKTIKMRTHIDETLLGGLTVRADDLFIDGSVSGQLKQLHKKLVVG